jgi:hypothetical protein
MNHIGSDGREHNWDRRKFPPLKAAIKKRRAQKVTYNFAAKKWPKIFAMVAKSGLQSKHES